MSETFLDGKVELLKGECLEILSVLEENSIDSCATDPPYHLQSIVKRFAKTGRTDKTRTTSGPHQRTANGFMNKTWDGGDIAFRVETWEAVLRVLKPGAYIVAFSSSRTFGRMSVAIEDAGFITHPMIGWIFGQGFPKAHKIEAEGWEGWRYGAQSMKPALEPIYLGQKPFSEKTGTANILRWGTGALNIDGCRIASSADDQEAMARVAGFNKSYSSGESSLSLSGGVDGSLHRRDRSEFDATRGRWPANLIHDGSDGVVALFPDTNASSDKPRYNGNFKSVAKGYEHAHTTFGHSDNGGSAARFFYSAKADADDRLGSRHPTVKPLDLMQYLVRLVTPPGGLVLDPFAGTGTTGEAVVREGMRAILIEREAEYQADIRRRMALCLAGPGERSRESIKAAGRVAPDDGPLFQ